MRLAESMMGRIDLYQLGTCIPAHFIGSIIGIVLFRNIFPFIPPVVSSSNRFFVCFCFYIILIFIEYVFESRLFLYLEVCVFNLSLFLVDIATRCL